MPVRRTSRKKLPIPSKIEKPPLKWAGAKTKLVSRILSLVPASTQRLVEPFAGSAVLALNTEIPGFILADINEDLITLYKVIRDNAQGLITRLEQLFVPANNARDRFDQYRVEFNTRALAPLEHAALFVYLNRHAFNGLCRYNASGGFNVPFGAIKQPLLPRDAILHASKVLLRAELINDSFEKVISKAGEGDFVYCDPPYTPLSASASFTHYATSDFGRKDQVALVEAALQAAERGAVVAISNHDTPETRQFYGCANKIFSFPVRRTISSDGANRKHVQELIAMYQPVKRKF